VSVFDKPFRIEAFDLSDRSERARPGQQTKAERKPEETTRPVIRVGSALWLMSEHPEGHDWLGGVDLRAQRDEEGLRLGEFGESVSGHEPASLPM